MNKETNLDISPVSEEMGRDIVNARLRGSTQEETVSEAEEPIRPATSTVNGWTRVEAEDLPTRCMFYKDVFVKPLSVQIVREIAVSDPSNVVDTLKGMTTVLDACCKVVLPDGTERSGSYLKRADALNVILIIRMLTYDEDSLKLKTPATCESCGGDIDTLMLDDMSTSSSSWDDLSCKADITINPDGSFTYNKERYELPTVRAVSNLVSLLSSTNTYPMDEITKKGSGEYIYMVSEDSSNGSLKDLHRAIVDVSSRMYGMGLKEISRIHKFIKLIDTTIGSATSVSVVCPKCKEVTKIPFPFSLSDLCLDSVEGL